MAIGPPPGRGPVLPPMGGGRGPDLPPAPNQGGQAEALVQRFLSTASELKQITDQLAGMGIDANQLLAGEVTTGGGPEGGPPVGGVGGMPQMPVAANTGPPSGLPPGLIA